MQGRDAGGPRAQVREHGLAHVGRDHDDPIAGAEAARAEPLGHAAARVPELAPGEAAARSAVGEAQRRRVGAGLGAPAERAGEGPHGHAERPFTPRIMYSSAVRWWKLARATIM